VSTQKLCACDQTCQSPICAEIEFVDTVKQPFAAIVKNLSEVDKSGLWLNPFRGIPRGPRLCRFDVIYLDEHCRVLEFAENFTEAEFEPFYGEAASALILPPHTLGSFQIRKRDRLRICSGKSVLAPSGESDFSAGNEEPQWCADDPGTRNSQTPSLHQQSPIDRDAHVKEVPSFKLRMLRWLFNVPASTDRRRGERFPAQALVAYYWTGGEPKANELGNVSHRGLYLLTEERWHLGTRIVMTLQKRNSGEVGSEEISRVESKVVRWGKDGIGCEFVQSEFVDLNTGELVQDREFDQEAFAKFLGSLSGNDSGGHQWTIDRSSGTSKSH
jgi:hypothetical protein